MLTPEQRSQLDQISPQEIYDYFSQRNNENIVKKYSSPFCFLQSEEQDEDGRVLVEITETAYFDQHGYLNDCYYDGDDGIYLEVPYFLEEIMESTYQSKYSWGETRKKMLELGFTERLWS